VYNVFTGFYFVGVEGFPYGMWLCVEVGSELVMVVDLVARIWISLRVGWKRLWMLNERTPVAILAIGSTPVSLVTLLSGIELTHFAVAFTRLVKLMRYPQLSTFFRNQEVLAKRAW
jgi:hypothetical protein